VALGLSGIADVRALGHELSNWGRWGPDDQLGTLNFVRAESIRSAAHAVSFGQSYSLAIPLDESGPQSNTSGRFNPIHLMRRDGADIASGAFARDFQGGVARNHHSTDDIVIMPLQAGTQWDALAHVMDAGKMYNDVDATWVTSRGAIRNHIALASDRLVARGVLIDVPRMKGVDWLAPGEAISAPDVEESLRAEHTEVKSGDIVLVRTGRMAQVKTEGAWNGYAEAGGGSPGLGIDVVAWLSQHEVAAVASDTLAVEVLPSQVPDVPLPLHLLCIVHLGMMLGEMFDLEALAEACSRDGRHDFLFVAPPLPFTYAVGSPTNPIAIR
jgi:kynurenine formamidase